MSNKNFELLKKSFDTELSPDERKILKSALDSSPELRKEKEGLIKIRSLLSGHDYTFSPDFTEKVMNGIVQDEHTDLSKTIVFAFNRIALPGLAAAIILLLFTILGNSTSLLDAILGVESLQPEYLSEFLLFNY
nr:hypothetical protein [Bacteroidota bacterium]